MLQVMVIGLFLSISRPVTLSSPPGVIFSGTRDLLFHVLYQSAASQRTGQRKKHSGRRYQDRNKVTGIGEDVLRFKPHMSCHQENKETRKVTAHAWIETD